MDNIVAITPFTNKNDIFKNMLKRIKPIPDLWIVYNDKNRLSISKNLNNAINNIAKNYNILQDMIPIDKKIKYVYIQEDDIELQSTIISDMLKNFKFYKLNDIIGINVCCRRTQQNMIWCIDNKEKSIDRIDYTNRLYKKINAISFNSVLMKYDIIKKIKIKGFDDLGYTLDVAFFRDCNKLNYRVYCDLTIPNIHNKQIIYKGKYMSSSTRDAIKKIRNL